MLLMTAVLSIPCGEVQMFCSSRMLNDVQFFVVNNEKSRFNARAQPYERAGPTSKIFDDGE